MRLAVGSDEQTSLTDMIVREIRRLGHEVELYGPLLGHPLPWPDVAQQVARRVSQGACDQGVLLCWTGTGVSIAANKVPGVRAALCTDAETARGARKWNDANVLCMGLRLTSEALAKEMLDAWFNAQPEESEAENIAKVVEMDKLRQAG
ncbi:MAG: RpiB/LacA/LacB family sugar-phosphate isomerase [Chloroflexi bacterium]|nr:RpiB/LacA/LacB family sugar-phosphate isomerase [Chloroflexota bacterium]